MLFISIFSEFSRESSHRDSHTQAQINLSNYRNLILLLVPQHHKTNGNRDDTDIQDLCLRKRIWLLPLQSPRWQFRQESKFAPEPLWKNLAISPVVWDFPKPWIILSKIATDEKGDRRKMVFTLCYMLWRRSGSQTDLRCTHPSSGLNSSGFRFLTLLIQNQWS